jgi:hypothetical protein
MAGKIQGPPATDGPARDEHDRLEIAKEASDLAQHVAIA